MNINNAQNQDAGPLHAGVKYARRSTAASFFLANSQCDYDALFAQLSRVIGQLEHYDENSKYSQLKRQKVSQFCPLANEMETYNQIYIISSQRRSSKKYSDRFMKAKDNNSFWHYNDWRREVYNFLLEVSELLDLSFKTYVRAIMLSDCYLLAHMDSIKAHQGDKEPYMIIIVRDVVIASLFLSHKCECDVPYSQLYFARFLHPNYQHPHKIAAFEEDIFETCKYDACFDSYVDIIDYELVRNHYGSSEFDIIKLISENLLLQTLVVDQDFLLEDVNLYCLALIILTLKLMYTTFIQLCTERGVKKQIIDLKRQQFLHEQNIIAKSGFDSSVIAAVVDLLKKKLKSRDETDPEYPQAILQVTKPIRVFLDNIANIDKV